MFSKQKEIRNLKCLQKLWKLQINMALTVSRKKNLLIMLLKWQMISAGIEVVTDKKDFQWMKEQIDEINITLEMLEEKPLQMQFNEKKEIEELSTSYNDTQARSQSLKQKIILDSSNIQEFINNLNFLNNTKKKLIISNMKINLVKRMEKYFYTLKQERNLFPQK